MRLGTSLDFDPYGEGVSRGGALGGGSGERCMGIFTTGTDWHNFDCGPAESYLCEWQPPE